MSTPLPPEHGQLLRSEHVTDTTRRAMLANSARTYYPGVLNDCYFDPAAALCLQQSTTTADTKAKPGANHCQPGVCRNSCVTDRHAPAIRTVVDNARDLLTIQRLSSPQRAALHQEIATMTALLKPLTAQDDA
ncbi:hypothetical protein BTZ20_0319 [Rhodococcus sp. MTM3W5.2]|uniref:hypothetical protein n=1 Tax=Rhodococcus sp. MTM3W5.2 TaxID=1805827 RepID=UPI0009794AF8|nr:hypothetical protein [Rhodococcus sp. MTM3W5.2]AQA25098.1 hypothetical protein BTZ20_0319 [Rhodococcus sp. MTM3W5.2]